MAVQKYYKLTFTSCFLSIANQAVMSNITAILFVPFMTLYDFSLWQFGLLIGINFGAQMVADVILTFLIDKFGFRPLVLFSVLLSAVGLLSFGLVPILLPPRLIYAGIVAATILFSFSGGMLEVIISPIVENIPSSAGSNGKVMSFMHSFYAWGQVATIIITSLFLFIFKSHNWYIIVFFWMIIPLTAFVFFVFAPLDKRKPVEKRGKTMLSPFFIVAMLAIAFGGCSEILMNQWSSTFASLSLGLSKMTSDLVGMCLFALLMGGGRLMYGLMGHKFNLQKFLVIGAGAACGLYLVAGLVPIKSVSLIACILCGFFTSLLWPGTLTVASERFPQAGMWIFAVLAISGDLGATIGPGLSGFVADSMGLSAAIAIAAVAPLGAFLCHLFLLLSNKKKKALPLSEGKALIKLNGGN